MLDWKEKKLLKFIYNHLNGEHKDYVYVKNLLSSKYRVPDNKAFEAAYLYDKNYQEDGDFTKVTDPVRMTYDDYLILSNEDEVEAAAEEVVEAGEVEEVVEEEEEIEPVIPIFREGFGPGLRSGTSYTISNSTKPTCQNYEGVIGTLIVDNEYLYICVAPNTWKKYRIAPW